MKRDLLDRIKDGISEKALLVAGSMLAGVGSLGVLAVNNPAFADFVKLLMKGSIDKRIATWQFLGTVSPTVIWPLALLLVEVLTVIVIAARKSTRLRANYDELRQWKERMSDLKYGTN